VYPLDTAKRRLQAQGMRPAAMEPAAYRGMLDALVRITREEGALAGLVPGHAARPGRMRGHWRSSCSSMFLLGCVDT